MIYLGAQIASMPLTYLLRNTLGLAAICTVFYFSSTGCKKTVVEKYTYDTTIVKDTTIIVDSTLDKAIIINLWQNNPDGGQDTTTAYLTLFKFNKNDYLGVDSIVFSANPAVLDTTGYCIVSLYDITDSVAIAGSSLSSNQYFYSNSGSYPGTKFLQTSNLYNALPSKQILLGATIKGTKFGGYPYPTSADVSFGYLYMYRK